MKFYSRKGFSMMAISSFLLFLSLFCLINEDYILFAVILAALFYLLWTIFDTHYVISDNKLHYKSALLKGSIEISSIVEITRNRTMFAGLRPATATKGIIIRYNKWDDIYMSPANADAFVQALMVANPAIKLR
jgi:hypothetical protein